MNKTSDYDYSYFRDVIGHLAVLVFVKATDLGLAHLAELDLTPKEAITLEFVANNPQASQKEIGRETGTKQSLLVKILDRLTARGLLQRERSTVDRRRQHVRLTSDGEALRGQIRELIDAANRELLDEVEISAEEEKTLVTLMQKLINHRKVN